MKIITINTQKQHELAELFLNATCISKNEHIHTYVSPFKKTDLSYTIKDKNMLFEIVVLQNPFTNTVDEIRFCAKNDALFKNDAYIIFNDSDADVFYALVDKVSVDMNTKEYYHGLEVSRQQSKEFMDNAKPNDVLKFTVKVPVIAYKKAILDESLFTSNIVFNYQDITLTKEELLYALEHLDYSQEKSLFMILNEVVKQSISLDPSQNEWYDKENTILNPYDNFHVLKDFKEQIEFCLNYE